jgi:hypothetical protein
MSRWCNECYKEPCGYCDESCPIFGLHLEDLAKKYFEVISEDKSCINCQRRLNEKGKEKCDIAKHFCSSGFYCSL